MTLSQISTGVSTTEWSAWGMIPALLYRTSRRPNFSIATSTMAFASASTETSTVIAVALPPAARIWRTVSSAEAFCVSATTTLEPSAEKRRAATRPIPLPAPVMIETFSFSRIVAPPSPGPGWPGRFVSLLAYSEEPKHRMASPAGFRIRHSRADFAWGICSPGLRERRRQVRRRAVGTEARVVAVAGGTVFVGGAIAGELASRGHHVIVLSHRPPATGSRGNAPTGAFEFRRAGGAPAARP